MMFADVVKTAKEKAGENRRTNFLEKRIEINKVGETISTLA